ncbi:MAG: hypothetical protein ACYTBZ_18005, partial [Planctomycetota bacterium]
MKCLIPIIVAASVLTLSPLGNADELPTQFAHAQPEFSPAPIWWWSGDPIQRERIREQLEQMAAGGIYNVIILN